MKKYLLAATCVAFMASCNESGETAEVSDQQNVVTAEGTTYTVDTTTTITWSASKPTATHVGTFKLKEGQFIVSDNQLAGGSFTIDIASLVNNDLTAADGKEKLEGHLKSPDFFDVAKYPTATFAITNVQPYTADSARKDVVEGATHLISGNLTLKDSTKNVTFPAKVVIDANGLSAKAEVTIDRTDWGMNYKGPNNPQDWFIRKDVNLKMDILATKK